MDTFITFISDLLACSWALACIAILIAAFFAASETAIVFANKAHIRELAEAGNARAGRSS